MDPSVVDISWDTARYNPVNCSGQAAWGSRRDTGSANRFPKETWLTESRVAVSTGMGPCNQQGSERRWKAYVVGPSHRHCRGKSTILDLKHSNYVFTPKSKTIAQKGQIKLQHAGGQRFLIVAERREINYTLLQSSDGDSLTQQVVSLKTYLRGKGSLLFLPHTENNVLDRLCKRKPVWRFL